MQQVDDMDRYSTEYLCGLRPLLTKYGTEVLVAGFDAEPAEGEPPNSTVVIRADQVTACFHPSRCSELSTNDAVLCRRT